MKKYQEKWRRKSTAALTGIREIFSDIQTMVFAIFLRTVERKFSAYLDMCEVDKFVTSFVRFRIEKAF